MALAAAAADGQPTGPTLKDTKVELMKVLTKGTGLKGAADARNQAQVAELLLALEAMNPTQEPAGSDFLNGAWELLYTGGYSKGFIDSPTRELALLFYTAGFRPGLLSSLSDKLPPGLIDVDFVSLKISPGEPRVVGTVKTGIAGNLQDLTTEGTLVQQSSVRLTETFTRARALGQAVDLPGPLKLSRDLYVTFLDQDFLVARDESGVPDVWLRQLRLSDMRTPSVDEAAPMPSTPEDSEAATSAVEGVVVEETAVAPEDVEVGEEEGDAKEEEKKEEGEDVEGP